MSTGLGFALKREHGFLERFFLEASERTLDTIDQLDAKISNVFVIRLGGVYTEAKE